MYFSVNLHNKILLRINLAFNNNALHVEITLKNKFSIVLIINFTATLQIIISINLWQITNNVDEILHTTRTKVIYSLVGLTMLPVVVF